MFEQTPTAPQELLLARELLEYAVLFSVSQKDEAAAERNFNQLRPYYADCRHVMPASPQEHLVTGLNLLRLLVQNRIAEFHTELELIPAAAQADKHVKHPVDLEQHLMEGSYNKILKAQGALPSPDYAHYMGMFTATVRDEIAACMEKAYATLSTSAAAKLLSIASAGEMLSFGEGREWTVAGGDTFVFRAEAAAPSAKDIPSMQLINQTLLYAKELERIV
jgi:26S proteasome regulatory subunit N12